MSEVVYTVKGIHCQSCVNKIRGAVEQIGGVEQVDVDPNTERVVVRGGGFDDASVRAAIQSAGYEAA